MERAGHGQRALGDASGQHAAEFSDLDYWYREVAAGFASRMVGGRMPDARTPSWMRRPGPFRDSLVREFAFRSIAEERAARVIGLLVDAAPTRAEMAFLTTQIVDEARHADAFRAHVGELIGSEAHVDTVIAEQAAEGARDVLRPLEAFARRHIAAPDGYVRGVAVLTILVEGVLAPTGELSERKWAMVDPAAASVERGAAIDEVRHLAVGSEIIRRRFTAHHDVISEVLAEGMALWQDLPIIREMTSREEAFDAGLAQVREASLNDPLAELLRTYEVWDGRRLIDTTAEEPIGTALEWSESAQHSRLEYMGVQL
ncbi:hypothetical protein GCM10027289_17560 [Tsukamurella serpentis]